MYGTPGVGFTDRPKIDDGSNIYREPVYSPPPSPPPSPIVTGLEPAAYEAILYGKEKPLFIGGKGLMGGRPNEGIFWSGTQEDPLVSFIAYHAQAANPTGTRTITDARLRGKSVSYDGSGNLLDAELAGGKVTFRTGTRDQLPFQQSIDRYGANAIAYRDGILSSWENIPVKPFGGIVPMPSIEISDSSFGDPADGITRQDALEVILRYSRLDDTEFEVSVPGSDSCWIIGSKTTLLDFLQQLRGIFVHWNITSTDKLYITDPTNFTIDVDVTRNNHLRDSMTFIKTEPLIIPRKKNYNYIDQDRDFEPNVVSAQEDVYPAPSTSSIEESTVNLPIVTTAAQATADIHVSLFEELAARSQMTAVLMPPLFAAAAGDAVRFADHDDINYIGRIMETQHDFETYQVDIKIAEILNCGSEAVEQGAVHFDGNTVLARGGTLTGVTDASTFILSVWIKDGSGTTIVSTPNYNFEFRAHGYVAIWNAADPINKSIAFQYNGFVDPGGWVHWLIAADVTTVGYNSGVNPSGGWYWWYEKFFMYVNDAAVPLANQGQSGEPLTGFTIGWESNETEFEIGGAEGFGAFEGDMAELYFAPGQYLDFSVEANRRKFITWSGVPEDLGSDGSTPTGAAPAIYMSGDSSNFATNQGSGGAFTVSGTLTDAATTPWE